MNKLKFILLLSLFTVTMFSCEKEVLKKNELTIWGEGTPFRASYGQLEGPLLLGFYPEENYVIFESKNSIIELEAIEVFDTVSNTFVAFNERIDSIYFHEVQQSGKVFLHKISLSSDQVQYDCWVKITSGRQEGVFFFLYDFYNLRKIEGAGLVLKEI
jgi:hypothetical protein